MAQPIDIIIPVYNEEAILADCERVVRRWHDPANWPMLRDALEGTMKSSAMIMLIVIGAAFQRGLIPKKRDFSGLDVAISFEPCKWVGGDYVDAVPMADGRILFAVADVCGKGPQAALISSSLHTMVRATVDSGRSLPELMERLNRHLCDWLPAHSFVTMVAVAINPKTGQTECVNAGHPPAMIGSPNGELRLLQSAVNPALGVAIAKMESQLGSLRPGEVLALYTDGLTELRNTLKEMLGQDRLGDGFARLCRTAAPEGVSEIAAGLHQILESFRGDRLPEDDRAFLLARRA